MKYLFGILLFFLVQSVEAQCLEGNCFNGWGVYKCSCGYVFEGEFENGEKVKGTLTKEDLVYTGEFKNDVAEGIGVIRFADSTWYEGEFEQNLPHGFGIFHYADGTTYTGEMEEGKFSGPGVMQFYTESGKESVREMGLFLNDQLDHFAIIADTGGEWFLGDFDANQKHGFGLVYVPNTSISIADYRKNKKKKEIATVEISSADSGFTQTIEWSKEKYIIQQKESGIFVLTTIDSDGNSTKVAYDFLNMSFILFPFSSTLDGTIIFKDGKSAGVKVQGEEWFVQPEKTTN